MPLLRVENLSKSYGRTVALADVDLSIEEGEFVTLLGPSGSGKTTLLMSIAGFAAPDSGTISSSERDITHLEPEDRDFGFVFQGYALFPHLSVADNIAFPLKVRRWARSRIGARVEEMLALVGLSALGSRRPRELSGGQQQRVAIARALAFGPRMLLLDEPLSALDRQLRETMQAELRRLHRETGVTFLYVTHDQEEAVSMSDRIAVFNAGRIVEVGPPRDLYSRPASRFVAGFLGENNFFSGMHRGDGVVETLGTQVRLAAARPFPAGQMTLWARPEHVRIGTASGDSLAVEATVVEVSFVGATERVTFSTRSGAELVSVFQSDLRSPGVGERIRFFIHASKIGVLPSADE